MNLRQCEAKAQDIGFDTAVFMATFPCGLVKCQWLDAYIGLFKMDLDGFRDGFVTTRQIDNLYPELVCSEPYIE